jgi:GT2 family glycosyltransferase
MSQYNCRPVDLRALLVFVAYHPGPREVDSLTDCLNELPCDVGYAIVSNDHRQGSAVESLRNNAILFLSNQHNPGYGRAVNQLVTAVSELGPLPEFIGILNTDLTWKTGTFEVLIDWLSENKDVVLAVPQITDPSGQIQKLCKQDPTILALISRRFFSTRFKPSWLLKYDRWYVMDHRDYQSSFEVPYLSGCCMLMRYQAFHEIGGFDEKFFLYLEDADITRRIKTLGRAIHLPIASIIHNWGRGNHRSRRLTIVNIHSAWIYFRKWGVKFR